MTGWPRPGPALSLARREVLEPASGTDGDAEDTTLRVQEDPARGTEVVLLSNLWELPGHV